ncbi:MAG: hypothetical protein IPJ88_14310 [Myxococcales bacterium]|nr:MAG: hypothetical protein IPJ88_14310 [Myxococcales bacterium]
MASWVGSLKTQCAELIAPAEQFVNLHDALALEQWQTGHAAVRRLYKLMDAWMHGEGAAASQSEELFIQGAGSVLGLLLAEHYGGAHFIKHEGKYRLRFGDFAFCDPYSMVEGVLDADEPQKAFAELLLRAEDEVKGQSTLCRLKHAFLRVLEEERPELAVEFCFEAELRLSDGSTVDLARLLRASEGESDAQLKSAVTRLVRMLPGAQMQSELSVEDAMQRVLPRIVPANFFEQHGVPRRGLCTRILGVGLHLSFILAFTGRSRFVRQNEL